MIDEKKIEEAAQGAADLYEKDLPIMSYYEDIEVDNPAKKDGTRSNREFVLYYGEIDSIKKIK